MSTFGKNEQKDTHFYKIYKRLFWAFSQLLPFLGGSKWQEFFPSHRLFKSLNSWVTFQVVWCHLACQSRTSTTFCVSRWESDFQNSSLIFSCNSKPLVCVRSMRRSLIRGGNFSPKQFDTKSVLDNCILSPYNAKKGRNERRPPRHPLKVLYYRH